MSAAPVVLYHCENARSFRVLWTMKELGLKNYRLVTMPFPPRAMVKGFTKMNPLGTIPYLVHEKTRMTESCGMCLYLVQTFGPSPLQVAPNEPDFGAYLNWVTHADATLTFPQTVYLRFHMQEPDKKLQEAGSLYAKWFMARLKLVDTTLEDGRQFLCAGRFTIADVCVSYALDLAEKIGIVQAFGPYKPQTQAYLQRLRERPAYKEAEKEQASSLHKWLAGESKL